MLETDNHDHAVNQQLSSPFSAITNQSNVYDTLRSVTAFNDTPPPIPGNHPNCEREEDFEQKDFERKAHYLLCLLLPYVQRKKLTEILKNVQAGTMNVNCYVRLPLKKEYDSYGTANGFIKDILPLIGPNYEQWLRKKCSTKEFLEKGYLSERSSWNGLVLKRVIRPRLPAPQNDYADPLLDVYRKHRSVSQTTLDQLEDDKRIARQKRQQERKRKLLIWGPVLCLAMITFGIFGSVFWIKYTEIDLTKIRFTETEALEAIDSRGMMMRLFHNRFEKAIYVTRQSVSDRHQLSFLKYSQQLHPIGDNKQYELTTNDLCLQVAEHTTCCSSFCQNQNLNITHSLNLFAPNKRLLVFANGTNMLVRINETYSEIRRLDKSESPIALQATQKLTGDNPLAIFLNNTTPYSYSSFLVNETRTGHYELCTAKLDNAVRRSTNRFVLQHCWELPHLKLHADYVQRIALVPITQYVFAICQSWAEDRQLRYMARIYDRRTAEQAKMVAQIDGDPITAFDSATDIAFYSGKESLHSCYIKMDVSGVSRIRCRRYGLENVLNVKT